MLILLSPAKTLNESPKTWENHTSETRLDKKSNQLAGRLRQHSLKSLKSLMNISDDLAVLNRDRYQELEFPVPSENKTAIHLFDGGVYKGLDAPTLSEEEILASQDILRILSGLYGIVRPLDLIQPYRLEMGTSLPIRKHNNLYQFWGDEITKVLKEDLKTQDEKVIVNLASNEYFDSLNTKKLKAPIIDITFRELRDGELKFISYNAKYARGLMTRYAIQNGITQSEELKNFNLEGYAYDEENSKENNWFFVK